MSKTKAKTVDPVVARVATVIYEGYEYVRAGRLTAIGPQQWAEEAEQKATQIVAILREQEKT